MKILSVPFITPENSRHELLPLQAIEYEPWRKQATPSCKAEFSIYHFNKAICITFRVVEPFLHVKKRRLNGAVHKDNCVEFFIAFGNDKAYYNFEFNCLGSVKAAFGEGRQHRKFLPPHLIKPVRDSMEISLDNEGERGQVRWALTVTLPVRIFFHHQKQSLSGLTCSVNFAKCGDDLPDPHFLSWVDIPSATPDFHQPQFFGKLTFEPCNLVS